MKKKKSQLVNYMKNSMRKKDLKNKSGKDNKNKKAEYE